uniref:CAAX prenyl protease 1 homolog n=2 Tax=Oryza TaxID=4527 RepID=A0A0E0NJ86_ORYRU
MTCEVSGAAADRVGRRSGAMVAERQRAKPAARSGVMADEDGDSDKFEEEEWDDDAQSQRGGVRQSRQAKWGNGFMILMYIFETYLDIRQHRALKLPTLPKPLVGVISGEKFERSRAYSLDKSKFHFIHEAVTILMDTTILYYRVLPWVWKKSGELATNAGLNAENEILHTLAFLAGVMIWSQITDLPFSLYSTFVIEAKHGFNKQTIWLFIRDMIKGILLSILLGPPIVAAIIIIVQNGGPYLAIYLWGFMFALSLVMMTIYPIVIAPLFNKFTPLPEGVLREKIEKLAASLSFPLKKLFVVDGSTRSSHSNAYMYGFFKNKRIVLYDTLIQQCSSEDEIVSVIAHELGHWKLNHTVYSFVAVQLLMFLQFGGYTLVRNSKDLFESFGFEDQPVIIGLIIFQADAFAKNLGYAPQLRAALVKLQIRGIQPTTTPIHPLLKGSLLLKTQTAKRKTNGKLIHLKHRSLYSSMGYLTVSWNRFNVRDVNGMCEYMRSTILTYTPSISQFSLQAPMLSLSTPSSPPPPLPPRRATTAPTPVSLLRGAADRRDAPLTSALHAALLKSGALDRTQPLTASNSLLHAYLQCGLLSDALRLLDEMPRRDAATCASLVSALCRLGAPLDAIRAYMDMLTQDADDEDGGLRPNEFTAAALLQACGLAKVARLGRMVHGHLVTSGFCCDPFVVGSLVNTYAKVGDVVSAEKLLLGMDSRDVVSWTALLSGCVLNGMLAEALKVFVMMLEDNVLPNNVTMLSVIQACSLMGESGLFSSLHALVVRLGLENDVSVVNSLIIMYAKNGFVEEATGLFEDLYLRRGDVCPNSDVLSALLFGCTVSGSLKYGKGIHAHLIKMNDLPSISIENSLMGMYARFEQVDAAYVVFKGMQIKDIVSWNTMISCLAKSDHVDEALELFSILHGGDGLVPDFVTVLSVVQACSNAGLLQQGQMLHGYIIKSGSLYDVSICNALISMYAKLGRIDFSEQIFEQMDIKDIVSWNSMINAYGIHGDGLSSLRIFNELQDDGTCSPNAITFVSLISACSHSGLVSEGYRCFQSMKNDYRIEPSMDHYASVVDLLGRSGRFAEAEQFIRNMPVHPNSSIWGPLLAACSLYGNIDLAEKAAIELSILEPESDIWRVSLSNVYAVVGRWKDSAKIRTEMKRVGLKKEAGWSFVDVGGVEGFKFVAADTRHGDSEQIYAVLRSMNKHMADVAGDVHQSSLVSVIS